MREILFRGKDDDGVWHEGFYCVLNGKSHRIYTGYAETDCGNYYPQWYTVISKTVGQYTGLEDKNGTKIFEGDIVKCKHTIRFEIEKKERKPRRSYGGKYVKRTDSTLYYDFIYYRNYEIKFVAETCDYVMKNGSDRHKFNDNYPKYHELEVIGNIHDNPELLRGWENA